MNKDLETWEDMYKREALSSEHFYSNELVLKLESVLFITERLLSTQKAEVLRGAREKVEEERLNENTGTEGDIGYNQAIDDALAAIDSLTPPTKI